MSALAIKTFTDPLYVMRVKLDGVEFVFDFDYNGREDRWYFHLSTGDGTNLVSGVKVVPNVRLLERYQDPRMPRGYLIALALRDNDEPPGLLELGKDRAVTLYYYEAV